MRLLILGDSFVEGVGATNKNGWAFLLKGKFPELPIKISGIGGDTILKILDRLPAENPHEFDHVILEIGLNDSRFRPSKNGHEVNATDFKNGLGEFVRAIHIKNDKARISLLGLTRVNERLTDPYKEDKIYLNKDILKYTAYIRESAALLSCDFIELPIFSDNSYLADGLHPSDIGHQLICTTVTNYLKHELF